jgi:pimeloyl-ACP methyl ester carboxylesterase
VVAARRGDGDDQLLPLRGAHSSGDIRPITAPTLVIWGESDRYLGPTLAEPHHDDVPNLDRVERLPDASHWVHHDEAERVNQLLIDFFRTRPRDARLGGQANGYKESRVQQQGRSAPNKRPGPGFLGL